MEIEKLWNDAGELCDELQEKYTDNNGLTLIGMLTERYIKRTGDSDVRRKALAIAQLVVLNERFGLGLDVPNIDELIARVEAKMGK